MRAYCHTQMEQCSHVLFQKNKFFAAIVYLFII